MDIQKDYYVILGLINTAEEPVIIAAFRALARKYHPDTTQHEEDHARARFREIKEAYDVLSDGATRARYDLARQSSGEKYRNLEDVDTDPDNSLSDEEMRLQWKTVAEFLPEVEVERQALARISPNLAFHYQVKLLNENRYGEFRVIGRGLRNDFLAKYFSPEPQLIKFAGWLFANEERDSAKKTQPRCVLACSASRCGRYDSATLRKR